MMNISNDKRNAILEMTAPAGWRAKIGLILPSSENGQASHDFHSIFPEGVTGLVTRVMCRGGTLQDLERMGQDIDYAAELLASAGPTVISYCCTSGSFVKGRVYDREIIRKLQEITGVPATTMANAVVEALKAVNASNLLVICPYLEEVVSAELKYLEEQGFTVVDHFSFGLSEDSDIYDLPPWKTYETVMQLYKAMPRDQQARIDAVQITCGGLRTVEIIRYIEQATGLPCISSLQANAWHCLKLAEIHDPVPGFGRLLEMER